jgi:hypothetical protein
MSGQIPIPTIVDKVRFDYNGIQNYNSEGVAPYTLAGDKNGDYKSWTPSLGAHVLSAVPSYNGVTGTALNISFFVMDQAPVDCNGDAFGKAFLDDCNVCSGGNTGLTPNTDKDSCGVCFGNGSTCGGNNGQVQIDLILINADLNIPIKPIFDGDTMDLPSMITNDLNIEAVANPGSQVQSIEFNLNGNVTVESVPPYAMKGANQGNYNIWVPSPGYYNLEVTAYSGNNATGQVLVSKAINFVFTDSSDIDCHGDFSGFSIYR